MTTTVVGIKDFRQNVSKLAKKAHQENISYIVTLHNKPYLEIKPCFNAEVEQDDVQVSYYKTIEGNLDFWKSAEDDNIFEI